MRHVDIIPDWVILVLAVLVVAVIFRLFGSFGVLGLGVVVTAIWIAQIIGRSIRVPEPVSSRASESQSDASSPSRPR